MHQSRFVHFPTTENGFVFMRFFTVALTKITKSNQVNHDIFQFIQTKDHSQVLKNPVGVFNSSALFHTSTLTCVYEVHVFYQQAFLGGVHTFFSSTVPKVISYHSFDRVLKVQTSERARYHAALNNL